MNNDAKAGWPNVPAEVPGWELFNNLRSMTTGIGATAALKGTYGLQRRLLLVQLKLMSNTRCHACGGRGHRAKDCPTNFRLGMLSSSTNEWKNLIARTRKMVEEGDLERMDDLVQAPAFHNVPMGLNRKRTHATAFPLK